MVFPEEAAFKNPAGLEDFLKKVNKSRISPLWLLPVVLCGAALVACLASGREITVETYWNIPRKPHSGSDHPSGTVRNQKCHCLFPVILLELASGCLFPPWTALLVNSVGLLIVLTVPYWIGRAAGAKPIQDIAVRYPKFATFLRGQQGSTFFLCFFLRIISCLPGDVVSMYLGATKVPFWQNLIAGMLGLLPGMVLATLIGSSIRDPSSPMFWGSATLMFALSILSLILYCLYSRKTSSG